MGMRDIFAGIAAGIGGDPTWPMKMKMAQEQLKMEHEKADRESKKQSLEAEQMKLHMKVLEHQLKATQSGEQPLPGIAPQMENFMAPTQGPGQPIFTPNAPPYSPPTPDERLWRMGEQGKMSGDIQESTLGEPTIMEGAAETPGWLTGTGYIKPTPPSPMDLTGSYSEAPTPMGFGTRPSGKYTIDLTKVPANRLKDAIAFLKEQAGEKPTAVPESTMGFLNPDGTFTLLPEEWRKKEQQYTMHYDTQRGMIFRSKKDGSVEQYNPENNTWSMPGKMPDIEKSLTLSNPLEYAAARMIGKDYKTESGKARILDMMMDKNKVDEINKYIDQYTKLTTPETIMPLPGPEGTYPFYTRGGRAGQVGSPTGVARPFPSETVKDLSDMRTTYETMADVSAKAKRMVDKFGPLEGRWTLLKNRFMRDGPTQTVINEVKSLITIAYQLSGKQISEREMQVLQTALLPRLEQPYENFVATLEFAKDWLSRTHNNRLESFKESGYGSNIKPIVNMTVHTWKIKTSDVDEFLKDHPKAKEIRKVDKSWVIMEENISSPKLVPR